MYAVVAIASLIASIPYGIRPLLIGVLGMPVLVFVLIWTFDMGSHK